MNDTGQNASNSAVTELLERPRARDEVIRYFRIDFHRCVIRRGTRVKRTEKGPPRIEAR